MIKKEKDGGEKMENVIEILRVNWKQNLRYHVIGAVLFCLLIPFFFDINGMDLFSTAKVLEAYFMNYLFCPCFSSRSGFDHSKSA